MLEEYISRLENMITPTYTNKNNFKDRIKTEFEDPNEIADKKKKLEHNTEIFNRIQTEEEKKLIDQYIEKMGSNDDEHRIHEIHKENKMKLYEKILESENAEDNIKIYSLSGNKNNSVQSVGSKLSKTYSLSQSRREKLSNLPDDYPTQISTKEKIHILKIKNMNYRYELESSKSKISELTKKLEEYKREMEKGEKHKENNNRYLLKLENLLAKDDRLNLTISSDNSHRYKHNARSSSKISNKSKNYSVNKRNVSNKYNLISNIKNTNNSLVTEDKINKTSVNIQDKDELKMFISNLISENQKLKSFKNKVYEISKNYDNINENIINGIKQIQISLAEDNHSNSKLDKNNQTQNIPADFEKIIENMNKTLEFKQSEYNFLLESKQQEIKFLQQEILKLNDNVEVIKRDRFRDQKLITDYESELSQINSRTHETMEKNSESLSKEINNKLEKKIEPAKSTVQKIIKKFEQNFDLQDKNNVKLISNINRNIK